jgi:hypothetical protein
MRQLIGTAGELIAEAWLQIVAALAVATLLTFATIWFWVEWSAVIILFWLIWFVGGFFFFAPKNPLLYAIWIGMLVGIILPAAWLMHASAR